MKARAFLGIFLMAATVTASAAPDTVGACLVMYRSAIEAVGDSRAGEVASGRSELKDALASLEPWASRLAAERAALESDQQRLDVHNRERDSSLQLLDHQERVLDDDKADERRRHRAHQADLQSFNAACGGALIPGTASCDIWSSRIKATAIRGNAEVTALAERRADIERKRTALLYDASQDARRIDDLLKRRSHLDRGTARILGECAAGQSRALALKQIVNSPSRTIEYRSPSDVADKALSGLFHAFAREGALNATEIRGMRRAIANAGLKTAVKGLGGLYSAADMLVDTANAGVDQRMTEVTRNLFLVGDYAAVMKEMVDRKGAGAATDPRYVAMRKEIERLGREMPSSEAQMVTSGLFSVAALGEAFASVAGQYASKSVARAGNAVVRRVDIASRVVHGRGGISFYREAMNAVAEGSADETAKNGAKHIMSWRGRDNEAQGNR